MAKKTLYFDSYCGYFISVILENGKVTEFNFEKHTDGNIVGNIYAGTIESVLPGMRAYFVNCGLERNCYLAGGQAPDSEKYEGSVQPAPDLPDYAVGDRVLVQVVKPPIGKKGAKVTLHPSFIGKSLIYMPDTPFIGVSRKISDEELRKNLAYSAQKMISEGEGLVLRTAAPYAKRKQLENEYRYLKNIYSGIRQAFESAETGQLLYTDSSLPVRVLRDTLFGDIENIYVGEQKLKEQVESLVNLYPSQIKREVILHNTGRDMLDETGISKQILSIISPRAELDNGAYLIIEPTEALTVIDVNTGKFTGDYNLEQTVYHTNILAAREIARQVRLRNIGGIIVVDFIDMQNPAHNKALTQELERALKDDKAKCSVSPMSNLGLVEFSRKRIGSSPLSLMTKPCRYCLEAGFTMSSEYILLGLRAKLLNIAADGAAAVKIDLNADVFARLTQWQELLDDLKNRCVKTKIWAVPHKTYHEEQIRFHTETFELPETAVQIN